MGLAEGFVQIPVGSILHSRPPPHMRCRRPRSRFRCPMRMAADARISADARASRSSTEEGKTSQKAPISSLRDVSYTIGGVSVIEGVSLDLYENEIVAVLGPSGSGKSTLLRMLTGLTQPSTGDVLYRGKGFEGTNPGASIVFQTFALLPWLTVLENVELGLSSGSPSDRSQSRERAMRAIDVIGLDGYENAFPRELSGGMRQRVGFARALAVEPEILCMDEPFSALDVLTAENLRSEVLRLWQSGGVTTTCILIITHGIEEAVQLADRLVILERDPGRIRTILPVNLPHPRNSKSQVFQEMADLVYTVLTAEDDVAESSCGETSLSQAKGESVDSEPGTSVSSPKEPFTRAPLKQLDLSVPLITTQQRLDGDDVELVGSPRQRYPMLPGVRIGSVAGLLEFVNEGRVELYELEQRLLAPVDDLYPIVEAGEILGVLAVDDAEVEMTDVGRKFLGGAIDDRKAIVRAAISGATAANDGSRLIREIYRMLCQAPKARIPQELIFDTILLKHFSVSEARRQLEIAIEWARFAELMGYDSITGMFFLEDEEHAVCETE